MRGIGSPAVTIGDTWPLLSPLLTHSPHLSLTLLGSSFCPGVGGSSGQWKELRPCAVALALALSCCVILGKSLPLSEYLLSPL